MAIRFSLIQLFKRAKIISEGKERHQESHTKLTATPFIAGHSYHTQPQPQNQIITSPPLNHPLQTNFSTTFIHQEKKGEPTTNKNPLQNRIVAFDHIE